MYVPNYSLLFANPLSNLRIFNYRGKDIVDGINGGGTNIGQYKRGEASTKLWETKAAYKRRFAWESAQAKDALYIRLEAKQYLRRILRMDRCYTACSAQIFHICANLFCVI